MSPSVRRPTITEVAKHANVSVATVSRVLNDTHLVSEEARQAVQAAVRALRYRPNRTAQHLRTHKTMMIGLIISDIENPFYTSLVRAVENSAFEHKYSVLLCNTDEDLAKERFYLDFLAGEHVAGVIASPTVEHATSFAELIDAGIPVVTVDRRSLLTPVDSVMTDHLTAARDLMRHVTAAGHTRIGAILTDQRTTSGAERAQGVALALADAGLTLAPALAREITPSEAAGFGAAMSLLTLSERPSALFTGNNLITIGALKAIKSLGLDIPRDISVVGHDDLPWMELLCPPLTVSAQPIHEMGRQATELLLARIQGDASPLREIRLTPTLIVRDSCAAPQ